MPNDEGRGPTRILRYEGNNLVETSEVELEADMKRFADFVKGPEGERMQAEWAAQVRRTAEPGQGDAEERTEA